MGGTASSKQLALTIGGGVLVAGSLGYLVYALQSDNTVTEPIAHGDAYFLQGASADKAALFTKLVKEIQATQHKGEGAHLSLEFFASLEDWVYLHSGEQTKKLRSDAIPQLAKFYQEMKFSDFASQSTALSRAIQEKEEEAAELLFTRLHKEDIDLVNASRIYLIRYDSRKFLSQSITGSKLKNEAHLKQVNMFNLGEVITAMQRVISSRMKRGFENADPFLFPTSFKVQLEAELVSRFPHLEYDEFCAFVGLEDLKEDKNKWDQVLGEYVKLLEGFYHSQELYTPGIKIM